MTDQLMPDEQARAAPSPSPMPDVPPQVMSDEQAWAAPSSAPPPNAAPQLMSDEEAWTPAPVKIAQKQGAVKNILSAFNEGLQESTQGFQDLGFSEDTTQAMRDAGIYNDYSKGQFSVVKALNEYLLSPAASALHAVIRSNVGMFITGPISAIGQTAEELGLEGARGGAEELSEYVLNSPFLAEFEAEGLFQREGRPAAFIKSMVDKNGFVSSDLAKAKAAGVLDGEGVYMGTKEPTPEQSASMQAHPRRCPKNQHPFPTFTPLPGI